MVVKKRGANGHVGWTKSTAIIQIYFENGKLLHKTYFVVYIS